MLHQHSLLRVDEIRRQLAATLRRLQLSPTSSSEGDLDPVLKAAAAGLFLNAAQYDRTEYNPLRDSGRHVYRLIRHVQTGRKGEGAAKLVVAAGGTANLPCGCMHRLDSCCLAIFQLCSALPLPVCCCSFQPMCCDA
jgi:hypothetical protein